jgi:hypothetical protein
MLWTVELLRDRGDGYEGSPWRWGTLDRAELVSLVEHLCTKNSALEGRREIDRRPQLPHPVGFFPDAGPGKPANRAAEFRRPHPCESAGSYQRGDHQKPVFEGAGVFLSADSRGSNSFAFHAWAVRPLAGTSL